MKEMTLKDIGGFSIGNAQDERAKTGVTVIYFDQGATVGCDISGGGPASRETPLTDGTTANNPINALVFSGGSAYGLAASDGVMQCLEEHDIGYPTGFARVPLVCQSCIYDLGYGRSDIRPNAVMGYDACARALEAFDESMGNVGAGTGATVGKLLGMRMSTKAGLGMYALEVGELKIGAIVVVNAFGDIFNPKTGEKVAGLYDPTRSTWLDFEQTFFQMVATPTDLFHSNTTIGCIITNAAFNKAELTKIAAMTRNAYARCISPVGTMADGDSIYACSVGNVQSDINVVGTLASRVMEQAILKAIDASHIDDEEFLTHCRS